MTAEPTADGRAVASHWKTAGLVAGGLAVGYALVQERERVTGAAANVQDTLTNNGLTLMQKLSEMADAFFAKCMRHSLLPHRPRISRRQYAMASPVSRTMM